MNEEIKLLEERITEYAQTYYSGEATVSDEYFDSLVERLRTLNPDSEILKKTGWGFNPTGKKFKHKYGLFIGSLDKVHEVDEIPSVISNDDPLNFETVRISAKLDGLSVVTYYENGKLVQALTRGDGFQGIDVTEKIKEIDPSIVKLNSEFTGAVRGEVVVPQRIWDTDNVLLKLQEENPSANPRNFAAGVLNRNENTSDLKYLRYVTYKILYMNLDSKYILINEVHYELESYGFMTAPSLFVTSPEVYKTNKESLKKTYEEFKREYPCDGLVLSVLKQHRTDEISANDYKEIAFKFEAESKEVTVTNVTYNATRTGRVVPLVWFDPVELSGAMVQKATGYNAQFIKDNKINIGSKIKVTRSNEVIPKILEVIVPSTEGYIIDKCPNCGSTLRWNGVDLFCDNEDESQLAQYFLSTVAPLDGAGYALYQGLVDMFDLDSAYLLACFLNSNRVETFIEDEVIRNISGDVTKEKYRKVLEILRTPIDPKLFLLGCNIRGLGETNIKNILQEYPKFIEDLVNDRANVDKLLNIKGVGESLLESIKTNIDRIVLLYDSCIVSEYEVKDQPNTQFKVAITGALSMKRADFDKILEEHGISQSGNFKNGDVKFLITNNLNSTSSKMKAAIENGVEIISEEEFVKRYINVN